LLSLLGFELNDNLGHTFTSAHLGGKQVIPQFDFRVSALIALHTLGLGAIAGGVLLVTRVRTRRRWWGLLLAAEGLGTIGLLIWMSSRYWFGHQAIITVAPTSLLLTVSAVAVPAVLAAAIVFSLGLWARGRIGSRYWWVGIGVPILILPAVLAGGAMDLVSLTEASKPQPQTVESGELKIEPGFTVTTFLKSGISNPTSMAFGPDGKLYISNYNGDVWSVPDVGGAAGAPQLYSNQRVQEPVGLAWHGNDLYVASHGKVSVLSDLHGTGRAEYRFDVVSGLPSRLYPWHSNEGLAFGPDGRLYFAVGATTDAAPETHQYGASVLSVNPDGTDLRVFATGVRNPFALAFNSAGDLFGGDNGPDGFVVTPPDELNYIVPGGDYGFPRYFGVPPPNSGTRTPVALFPPHASADGIVFYEGRQFPAEYHDNAFLTLYHRGEIARVQLAKTAGGDYLSNVETFASGFANPLDIKEGPDGSLYVAEFGSGVIYRIEYVGGTGAKP
jgi:glucose/arabinose dehydrogenase